MRSSRIETVARLGLAVALLTAAAACGRSGPPDARPGSRTPEARSPQSAGATGPAAEVRPNAEPREPVPAVSGEIYLRERITLPAGTVVKVRVVRLGSGGSPAAVVAAAELPAPRHMPIPFELICDPESIEKQAAYGLEAEIVRGTATVFATAVPVPVLAEGKPTSGLKLLLRRAG